MIYTVENGKNTRKDLISRVNAVLSRVQRLEEEKVLRLHEILLDSEKRAVCVAGKPCGLTYKEFELLKLFLQNAGTVMEREQIMQRIWGVDFEGGSRTLDAHVKTLRKKLGSAGGYIKTVRNVGYRIE